MENGITIDEDILQQICNGLDEVTTPDNSVLINIFKQFQYLHSQLPTFCFYLLFIISSDQFPFNRRLCALIVLNRNFSHVPDEYNEAFLSNAKPLLEEIINLPFSPLTSISAAMLCSMAKLYGLEKFPDFFSQILSLFSNQDTIQVGLECLKEMIQNDQKIPSEILDILPQLIDSPYCKTTLDISYLLCSLSIEEVTFVHESILPLIFNFCTDFDENSLSQAGSISASLYIDFPIEETADFLIELLSIDSIKIRESILLEFGNVKSFHLYSPLIMSLFQLMEFPDDDLTEFGPCSMSQQILEKAASCHGEQFITIAKTFIDDHFTFIEQLFDNIKEGHGVDSSENVGWYLRCLYTILSTLRESVNSEDAESEIENEFGVYYTIILGCFESEFRGDAALCLMSFCFSNPQIVNESFEKILPLLTDDDVGIQYQSLISLNQLVEFSELDPEIDQFAFLIDLMKETNEVSIASLANRYAQHFPVLNDSNEYILNLYHELFDYFISITIAINDGLASQEDENNVFNNDTSQALNLLNDENDQNQSESPDPKFFSFVKVSSPIFQSLVDLLSLFIKVVVEPFDLIDKRIFISSLFSISHDYFEASMFTSYFDLIFSLLSTYSDQISSECESNEDFLIAIQSILQKVVEIVIDQNDGDLMLIKSGYEIISSIVSKIQSIQNLLSDDQNEEVVEFVEKLMEYSYDHFSLENRNLAYFDEDENDDDAKKETTSLNIEICSLICQIMAVFVPKMNLELASAFLEKCFSILSNFLSEDDIGEVNKDSLISVTKDFREFGLLLIELLTTNQMQIDENIYELFTS